MLTGVLRVAKESIFSDLNNLDVCSVLSTRYEDIIGFTPDEVSKMANDLHREDRLPEIRKWYDGYRFGEAEIYNPWSVINFFRNDCFGDYWVNTSGNGILRALLEKADAQRIKNPCCDGKLIVKKELHVQGLALVRAARCCLWR